MVPTVERLTHTALVIRRGIWITAGLTMAGSALTGALTFDHLKEFWGIGLATAFAVDVALWVVLTGDHALQALGLTSGAWGRIMRVGTAALSGLLNCGYSILMQQPYLAVLHAILPVLLVGLTEYHQGVAVAIEAAIKDIQDQVTRAPAPAVVVAPAPAATPPIEGLSRNSWGTGEGAHLVPDIEAGNDLQRSLHPADQPITQTPLRLVSPTAGAAAPAPAAPAPSRPAQPVPPSRSRAQTDTVAARRGGPVQAKAVRYLVRAHRRGVDLSTITPATLAAGIGGKVDTCRRNLDAWRSEALAASEVTA